MQSQIIKLILADRFKILQVMFTALVNFISISSYNKK